jgi:hypothetical protein
LYLCLSSHWCWVGVVAVLDCALALLPCVTQWVLQALDTSWQLVTQPSKWTSFGT